MLLLASRRFLGYRGRFSSGSGGVPLKQRFRPRMDKFSVTTGEVSRQIIESEIHEKQVMWLAVDVFIIGGL